MSAVIADTHTWLWAVLSPGKLSPAARSTLQSALDADDAIYLSAISLVEVAYLVEKGRFTEEAYRLLIDEVSNPDNGYIVVPLDQLIAQALRQIPREAIPDMPDRIIAATAWHLGLPLVTRDSAIRTAGLNTIW